jgi:RND superfamily putative drug exporter
MDYEVFLVSGMRESHAHGAEPTAAVVGGFRRGARVVTAAALIMTAVFSGFIFGDNADIKSVGFALAFGVLVDVLVVRMAIVPAVMSMLGRSAWWLPRWLARVRGFDRLAAGMRDACEASGAEFGGRLQATAAAFVGRLGPLALRRGADGT